MDQITVKGVYSQEANAEAERIMYELCNFLRVDGVNNRTTTIEAIQGLYMVTRWKNKEEEKVSAY